jgi:acetyltransferase-like isoleucine patch superfamily enzyme
MITYFLSKIFNWLEKAMIIEKDKEYREKFQIHKTARLGYLPQIVFKGNIEIGKDSYFNSGKIYSGNNSIVRIGENCAIGYNVVITAISHDSEYPTGPENERPFVEGSVSIGDLTWIGSNVFILPGVVIGCNCVVGANAVVT